MAASMPSGAPFKNPQRKHAPFGWLGGILCALSAIVVLVVVGFLINNLISGGDQMADEDLRKLQDIAPAAGPSSKNSNY